MKKPFPLVVAVIVVLAAAVYFGVQILATAHGSTADQTAHLSACPANQGATITITIRNDQMRPEHPTGRRCDKLTIVNYDDKQRLIAFGAHDHHQPYDGVTEKILNKDQSFSVVLDATGTFLVHDHYEDSVQAEFTVTN